MSRVVLERRLDALVARRRALRDELAVVDEQSAALAQAAADARLRALVSETPVADVEHRDASRSADAMARHRAVLLADLAALDRAEDELLDRLAAEAAAR
jgi:predicted  nucleic acid-binding Zn-ribbon protein